MNARKPTPSRFSPLKARFSGKRAITRQTIVTLIALAVLIVLAILAFSWYAGNVAQREMMVVGNESGQITVPPPVEVEGLEQSVDVPGNTSTAVKLGDIDDPDQLRSVCGYLTAELERLDYEFKQPLPPPVIDRIATQIKQLHTQANRYDCAPGKGRQSADAGADPDASSNKQGSPRPPARRRAAPSPG